MMECLKKYVTDSTTDIYILIGQFCTYVLYDLLKKCMGSFVFD